MTAHPLMKCGCAAQGVCNAKGGVKFDPPIPVCVVHECTELAESAPSLEGRTAKCAYRDCRATAPSALTLAFFVYRPEKPTDEFYCGCRGWD